MSTRTGRALLVAAAIGALLSGCTVPAAEPVATPEAPLTAPAAEPDPAPPVEFSCTDLDDALPDGFAAADPFGSAPVLAAFAAGGSACRWSSSGGGGPVASISVALLPSEVFGSSPLTIEPRCGELFDLSSGCQSREVLGELVAETVVNGDPASAETSLVREEVSAALSERLAEGARPRAAESSPTVRVLCPGLSGAAGTLPDSVGSFESEFGGTDSGAPATELLSWAFLSAEGMTGCITRTSAGFGVSMATLGRGADLIDDPRLVGGSVPLALADGRTARILIDSVTAPDGDVRDLARVVVDANGSVIVLTVFDGGITAAAAPLDQAATAIAEAIARAVDAGS